jgi:hypothetical protein
MNKTDFPYNIFDFVGLQGTYQMPSDITRQACDLLCEFLHPVFTEILVTEIIQVPDLILAVILGYGEKQDIITFSA